VRLNYAPGHQAVLHHRTTIFPARNKHWEPLLEPHDPKCAWRKGLNIGFTIQVDTLLPQDSELHREGDAGGAVRRVLHRAGETSIPTTLMAANKRQNKITEYRICCRQKWPPARRHHLWRATSSAFGATPRNRSRRDIEIIKRELPLDILEFFFLNAAAGARRTTRFLWQKNVWMDPDMNKYDLNHRVAPSFPKCRMRNGEEGLQGRPGRPITPPSISATIPARRAAAQTRSLGLKDDA